MAGAGPGAASRALLRFTTVSSSDDDVEESSSSSFFFALGLCCRDGSG
jgi:hypothetical protein